MVSSIMSYICNCQPAGHKKGDFSVALKKLFRQRRFLRLEDSVNAPSGEGQ